MQEGVFVATPDGDLLDCNDAFVIMLGYGSRDELMALDMRSVLHAVDHERAAFLQQIEAQHYVRNFETTIRRKDGTLLTVAQSCFATRESSGNIDRYQGFVLDITEKKRSEDEMRRRNRELNALNALAVIATQSFDLDEILNLTLRQVVSLFGGETGSIYLAKEPEGTYRRRAGWGPRNEKRGRASEVRFPSGLGDLVMRSRGRGYNPGLYAAPAHGRRSGSLLVPTSCRAGSGLLLLEQRQADRHHGYCQQAGAALFNQ